MIPDATKFSLRRARLLMLIVMIVLMAAIGLANSSSEPVTIDLINKIIQKESVERAYGWPVTWYWRSARSVPEMPPRPSRFQWQVVRSSASCLIANLTIWIGMLAASLVGCEWLLRRFQPRLQWRPRLVTLLILMFVSAPIVLANLNFDVLHIGPTASRSVYGWPLIWYWHVDQSVGFSFSQAWDFSASALAANLMLWILTLGVVGITSEWLMRRCWPQSCFSLKTLLGGVALAGVLCACYAAARNRAQMQDEVIALIGNNRNVYFERWGPKWLDLIGADRFRRRIVAARVDQEDLNDELFERLGRLPDLRFLDIDPYRYHGPFVFAPGTAAALGEMRQLRMLSVNCMNDSVEARHATYQCFAAIGKLNQLERLRVHNLEEGGDDLSHLAALTNLKTLALDFCSFSDDDYEERARNGDASTLANLPILPCLETLELSGCELGDENLGRLACFPRLTALNLSDSSVSDTGLMKLAPLESLEELAIDEYMATPEGLEALVTLKSLRAIHIAGIAANRIDGVNADATISRATLALDDGREWVVLSSEFPGLHSAIAALRESHPGIVIDARYGEFQEKLDLKAPWSESNRSRLQSFVRRWLDKP